MIYFIVDHSYSDDYFYIDDIKVKISDEEEKKRIEERIKKSGLLASTQYPDSKYFARLLGVDEKEIDIDVQDIDVY